AHVNLIYSPVPKMDFGFEFMYADREVESGADGDLTRLQFSAKYAF
ncbi:MAG: porin, partial [Xanthomonadales bacterium]|nr:porin [Xanthomonadales bacterium]